MNRLGTLIAITIIGVVAIFATPREVNCEYCGERFNNQNTVIEEICDICFGWNEHKASLTENGIQLEFSNGDGYYFQGR